MDTKALRQKILDLAIRGKLVPQDPNDEPASVLLERIREQKQQMVREGKLKKKDIKNDSVIFVGEDNLHYEKFADGSMKCIEDAIQFELPKGWQWVRCANIINLYSGQDLTPDRYNEVGDGIPYITGASNLENGKIIINRWTTTPTTHSAVGDLLLIVKGSGVGKMAFNDIEDVHIARQIMALRCSPAILEYYLFVVISSLLQNIISQANGIIPGIRREIILTTLIPVPPLNEQSNIGTAVKKLLFLVKKLEDDKNSLLNSLRLARFKILDLAIRGQLEPQDPDDEPASVLLERIQAEKKELIKQGKIKHDKKESTIFRGEDNSYYEKISGIVENINDKIPFRLPENWKFIRFKELWELISGRDLSPSKYNADCVGIPYITGASNFIDSKVELVRWTDSPQVLTETGDLLLTCKGSIGKMAFNDFGTAHIARQIMAIRNTFGLNSQYLELCMEFYIHKIKGAAKGLIPGISREDILNLILPVPPVKYQRQVVLQVQKINYLLSLIEKNLS